MRRFLSKWLFPLTLLAAGGLLFWTVWKVDRSTGEVVRVGFQSADPPPGSLAEGVMPDDRLFQYSAWQVAMIPAAAKFQKPLGMEGEIAEPVFAVADGLVVLAGSGKLILAHKDETGALSQSVYAGLESVSLRHGQLVPRGMRIGTVKPENFRFVNRVGSGLDMPEAWDAVDALRAEEEPSPSILERVLSSDDAPWTRLEIQGAERLSELGKESKND